MYSHSLVPYQTDHGIEVSLILMVPAKQTPSIPSISTRLWGSDISASLLACPQRSACVGKAATSVASSLRAMMANAHAQNAKLFPEPVAVVMTILGMACPSSAFTTSAWCE